MSQEGPGPAEPPELRAVVDRVVGDLAVLLIGEDQIEYEVVSSDLPDDVGEGTLVIVRPLGDGWEIVGRDLGAEWERRRRTRHLMDRIMQRQRGKRFGRRR